jgi:hypothetical protein
VSKMKTTVLSDEFKVAAQIFACNQEKQKIWYSKLVQLLAPSMNSETVTKSLRILFDWGIVKAEYGETKEGHTGRLLYIAGETRSIIKEIYENYWKESPDGEQQNA